MFNKILKKSMEDGEIMQDLYWFLPEVEQMIKEIDEALDKKEGE